MSVILAPALLQKFFDRNGVPAAKALLFTYAAGTTTKAATYIDSTQTTQNTNPIQLNAFGEANVWLPLGVAYKFVLAPATDTDPPTNPFWTVDQVAAPMSQAQFNGLLATAGGAPLVNYSIIKYDQTAAELAAGVTPVNYAIASHTACSSVIIERYGTNTTPGTTDMTTALNSAIAVANVCGLPIMGQAVTYKITAALNTLTSLGGIDLPVGYGSGDACILLSGTGYTGVTVTGAVNKLNFAVAGTGQAANGVYLNNPQRVAQSNIRVYNLAGFGLKIDKCWDCHFDTLSVERCGTSSLYAFSMNDAGDTCNETFIGHLQVEQSTNKAIFVSPNSVNCTFGVLHSERTTGDGTNPTHILGGNSSHYLSARIEGTSNVLVSLQGFDATSYNDIRCPGATINLNNGSNSAYYYTEVSGFNCANLTWDPSNVAPWRIVGGSVSGTVTLTSATRGQARIEHSNLTNLSLANNGTTLELEDCSVSGTISNAGGNPVLYARNVAFTNFPSMQQVTLDQCSVTNAYTLGTNQIVVSYKSIFNGALTLTVNSNALFYGYAGTRFNANLIGSSGGCYGILDQSCTLAQAATVGTDWYGTPGGLPSTLGAWDQGTIRYNPKPASAGYIGSVCTTGSSSGAGTWRTFGLIS